MSVFRGEMRTMLHDRYETLLAFCMAGEWAADPRMVYERLVDVASEYLECDAAHLHLLDIDGGAFVRQASHDDGESRAFSTQLGPNVGRMSLLIESRDLIVMDGVHPHVDDEIPDEMLQAGYRAGVSVPIVDSSGVSGMLTIVYRHDLDLSAEDHEFLLQLGQVLGTLIQRIQMSKKDVELQMLRERKQLSSEIHDNLSQMVSALAIRADIAQSCREEGDDEALDRELEALANQARQVTKVLREEMLSLRAPIEGAGDVVSDIAEILERFQAQWGIKTSFSTSNASRVVVSEYVRLQLARIVNECLQNVLRHSRATEVQVTLDRKNGNVLISVRDNGQGFDVAAVAPERLGIRIMRERAASSGGTLSVVSGSSGTTVFIEVPAARGQGGARG